MFPKTLVEALKAERKVLAAEVRQSKAQLKETRMRSMDAKFAENNEDITEAADDEVEALAKWQRIQEIDRQLGRHSAFESEIKKRQINQNRESTD